MIMNCELHRNFVQDFYNIMLSLDARDGFTIEAPITIIKLNRKFTYFVHVVGITAIDNLDVNPALM